MTINIAVIIFGIPRSTDVTLEPFMRHLVEPAREVGKVSLFGHLYEQSAVHNPRSGESSVLDIANYDALREHFHLITEPPGAAQREPRWSTLRNAGDFYEDEFKSLGNLIHQLHSIKSAYTLAVEQADPDVFVFARPDLLYHESIPATAFTDAAKNPLRCYLPAWQWWGGFNDRLAVCGRRAAMFWAQRLDMTARYCKETGLPLHAEKLLRHALCTNDVQLRLLPVRASRVRVGGAVHDEIFDPMTTYSSRSGLLKMIKAATLTSLGI